MPQDILRFGSFAECKVPYDRVNNYLDNIEKQRIPLQSLMIIRGGKVCAEGYYAPFDKDYMHRMYSSSKSFTAIAIGALAAEGKISLDDKVYKFFPDKLPEKLHPYIEATTIRHLLMMATPFKGVAYGRYVPDWTYSFFNTAPDHEPGTKFIYDTCGTYMMNAIIERVTGKKFLDYLKDVALREIGFSEDAWCIQSPDGYSWGGSGVIATTRDLARFAMLIKDKGYANGRQLLPADFIEDATSFQIDNSYYPRTHLKSYGYGYQIWKTYDGGFAFLGMGCQCAVISQEKDLIAIFNADTQGMPDYTPIEMFIDDVVDYIDEDFEADEEKQRALEKRLSSLRFQIPEGELTSPLKDRINGKEYTIFNNQMQIESVRFEFDGDSGIMYYKTLRGDKKIPFSIGEYAKITFPEKHYYDYQTNLPANRELDALSTVVFTGESTLLLRVYITDNSKGNMTAIFTFDGDKISIKMTKSAEWFLDEYEGVAFGKLKK